MSQFKENYMVSDEVNQFTSYLLDYIANKIDTTKQLSGKCDPRYYDFMTKNWYDIIITCDLKLVEQLLYISFIDYGNTYGWSLCVL